MAGALAFMSQPFGLSIGFPQRPGQEEANASPSFQFPRACDAKNVPASAPSDPSVTDAMARYAYALPAGTAHAKPEV